MARTIPATERSRHGRLARAVWQEVRPDGGLGEPQPHDVSLSSEQLRDLYRLMVVGRRIDRQAINLTRQGALGVYASSLGQEASQVGPVYALEKQDWIFPSYREGVAVFARGVDIVEILALYQESSNCGYDPMARRVAPLSVPLATQALHATGLAMAAAMRGDPVVALTFLGDGATSEGDAHEAMNMAAVANAPVVFLVQNNGYAISVPLRLQTRASAIALRAAGCGMRGIRVDGNDVISVYAAARESVQRARAGEGPTLIETLTYRIEAHTTADDPKLYRSDDEVTQWQGRDPIARFLGLLQQHEIVDAEFLGSVESEGEVQAARMREALYGATSGDPLRMFDNVYAAPRPQLERQRAQLAAELEAATETS
jgi:2-oxoisovalerate dehydrogenase E1 component alpha subunit